VSSSDVRSFCCGADRLLFCQWEGSMRIAMQREMRVAFSGKAQPVWFRVAK
jgi:hypothetical protein